MPRAATSKPSNAVTAARQLADDELGLRWQHLMATCQRVASALDRELRAAHGLSASEFEVLQQLSGAPDDAMMLADLEVRAHLSQSALSRLISRLVADDLVQRVACPHDRRALVVQLTSTGRDRFRAATPTQRAVLREHSLALSE